MIILTSSEESLPFETRQWPLMISRHFGGDWYLGLSGMRIFFYRFACFAIRLVERKRERKDRGTSVYWVAYRSSTKPSTKPHCRARTIATKRCCSFASFQRTVTRRRMIGVEFLEIYDRRWRSEIAKSETGILRIETRLDSQCVSAMKFYSRLHLTINIDEAIVSFLTYWLLCE